MNDLVETVETTLFEQLAKSKVGLSLPKFTQDLLVSCRLFLLSVAAHKEMGWWKLSMIVDEALNDDDDDAAACQDQFLSRCPLFAWILLFVAALGQWDAEFSPSCRSSLRFFGYHT